MSVIISSLKKSDGFLTNIKTADHQFQSDEPESAGGTNKAPSPVQMVLASLGACTAMTLKMYYEHKDTNWEQIDVHIRSEVKRVSEDELSEEEKPYFSRGKIRYIYKDIHIKGGMDDKAFERAEVIAGKCPVNQMMNRNVLMKTKLFRVK